MRNFPDRPIGCRLFNTKGCARPISCGTVEVKRSDELGKALSCGLAAKTQHRVPGWAADTCTRRIGKGVSPPLSAKASPHLAIRLIIQFLFRQASGPKGPPLRDRNRTTHSIFGVRVQQLKLYLRMVSRTYSPIQYLNHQKWCRRRVSRGFGRGAL